MGADGYLWARDHTTSKMVKVGHERAVALFLGYLRLFSRAECGCPPDNVDQEENFYVAE